MTPFGEYVIHKPFSFFKGAGKGIKGFLFKVLHIDVSNYGG